MAILLLTSGFLFFSSCLIAGENTAQSTDPLQTFYHAPSYQKLMLALSEMPKNMKSHQYEEVIVFAMMVINKHPDYAAEIQTHFASYPSRLQKVLLQALMANGSNQITKNLQERYISLHVAQSEFTPHYIETIKINNDPSNFDFLWAAYFATGNQKYLLRLMEYVHQHPVNYHGTIDMTSGAANWSLESNAAQDHTVKENIAKILIAYPELK